MATPFKLEIRQLGVDGDGPFKDVSDCFYEESRFVAMLPQDISKIRVMENKDLDIRFCSNEEARLYMDALNYWHDRVCKEDDHGDIYIEPADKPIVLFKNSFDAEKSNYYPFIPGTYRIYMVCNGKRFFSYVEVLAKQVTHQELEIMRTELESMLENLAKQRIQMGLVDGKDSAHDLYNQILLLGKNARKLIGVIDQVRHAPRSRIEKTYLFKKTGQPGEIDRETIKYRLRHPNQTDVLLIPEREISRNLPENQAVIQSVGYILKISRRALTYLENLNTGMDSGTKVTLNSRDEYSRQLLNNRFAIKKLANACSLFLNEGWVQEVKVPAVYTSGLQMDARYRSISQLSRKLKKTSRMLRLNEGYSYSWERTDKIYEMWCFVRIVHALQSDKLNFIPKSGWIYDNQEFMGSWHIPFLSEGTTIEFVKDEELRIRLVYDCPIERELSKTSFDEPLYTEFPQNRPDARLDIYIKDVYEGSIVIDFKYRPAFTIGTQKNYHSSGYAYKQLLHYSKFDSAFTGKRNTDICKLKKTRRTPVAGVWVMYPSSATIPGEIECVNDWLTKIPYSPRESLEKLETLLSHALQHIKDD